MLKTFTTKTTLAVGLMFLFSFTLCLKVMAINSNGTGGGDWNVTTTWAGGIVPTAGENVVIAAGDSVWVDNNTFTVNDITVGNASALYIVNLPTAALSYEGNLVVQGNARVTNNGRIDQFNQILPYKNFDLWSGAVYIHNPRANVLGDESIFEFSVENFQPTSHLIIQKWSNTAYPLGGNFRIDNGKDIGHLTTSVVGIWEMNGTLALGSGVVPNGKVRGTLTVLAGTLRMDDGTGLSQNLVLQDVIISGNSSIIFQEGLNRPFTFTCNNFTDNSTNNTTPTGFMAISSNSGFGKLKWIANGNVVLNHEFVAINGTVSENVLPDSIIINGDLTIGSATFTGNFNIHKQINGHLYLNVTGTTSILGNPGHVRFIDSGIGNLTFNTGNLIISGGLKNTFLGGNEALDAFGLPLFPLPTGTANVNIANDFSITAASVTHVMLSPGNVQKTRVNVGRDFITSATGVDFRVSKSIGPVSFLTGRHLAMTGGSMDVQNNVSSNALDSVVVGSNFTFNSALATNYFRANSGAGNTIFRTLGNFTITNSGTAVTSGVCGNYLGNGTLAFYVGGDFTHTAGAFRAINGGDGTLNFTVVGALSQASGIVRGIYNLTSGTSGASTFNLGSVNYTGGDFSQFHASNGTTVATLCTVTNNLSVNFGSVADKFSFNALPLVGSNNNQASLKLSVGGNMTIGGVNGSFMSSIGFGPDTINVTGDMTFNGGINSFNSTHFSIYPNFHPVVINIGGNLGVTNGDNYLSAYAGELTVTINGNMNVSGGSLTFKGDVFGNTVVNILGGYTQTNGTVYMYNNTLFSSSDDVVITVNSNDDPVGDFTHTGGTIVFDNNNNSQHLRTFDIKSPSYTLGGTGSMYRANAGVSTELGEINFKRTGTTFFTRTTNTHSIQQIKQKVFGTTTLNVILGSNIQIMSHTSVVGITAFEAAQFATVILNLNSQIYSNATYPFSVVHFQNSSRLAIQNIHGLYDNTTNAAFSSAGNLSFVLGLTSTVEYFGNDTQVLTGVGVGTATTGNQKYGNLEINFLGTNNVEFVYPTNAGTVNVRGNLFLKAGELNLDNDHVPGNGPGRTLILDLSPTQTFTRLAGYVRSEVEDGSGILKWSLGSFTTSKTVHFGVYVGATFYYIPVTYKGNSGLSGDVQFATYHTPANNLPYPPLVGHVNDLTTGLDNSANCANRFWLISRSGTNSSFDISFTLPGATENPVAFTTLKAQHYNYANGGWDNPFQGTTNTWNGGTFTQTVTGATVVNDWWTLVNSLTPLQVDLLSFTAECKGKQQLIKWTTASEENNDRFILEKSTDGKEYTLLTTVKGMGTTNKLTNYEVADDAPGAAINYYRLTQYDYDGRSEQFAPIAVNGCKQADALTIVSANASDNVVQAMVNSPDNGSYVLNVLSIAGKVLYTTNVNLIQGINKIPIPSSALSNGIYLIRVTNAYSAASRNVIVNH